MNLAKIKAAEAERIGNRHRQWAPHNCYRCAPDRDPARRSEFMVFISA